MKTPQAIELYADSARGIYIPQHFAQSMRGEWVGFDNETVNALHAGPEYPEYWDAWSDVLDNAEYKQGGHVWRLWQDGDLFVVCDELMTDDEYNNFYGEAREQ